MRAFTRHLAAKFRIITLDPLYWMFAIPLCFAMFVGYWIELPLDIGMGEWHGPVRWMVMAALTGIFLGGRTSTGKRVQLNKFAMPTLPVGPATRVAGEVAYLLILLLIARIVNVIFMDTVELGSLIRETLIGILVLIPIFVVFVPRNRGDRPYYILDTSVVVVTLCYLVENDAFGSLFSALLSSVGLVIVAVIIDRVEGLLYRSFRPQASFCGAMTRPYRDPVRQFRRDLWGRSWWQFRFHLGVLAAAQLAGILVHYKLQLPTYFIITWTGVLLYFWFGLMIAPAGISSLVSETGQKSTFYSDFDGSFLAAWSVLPIHPLRIVRSTYLYILVAASFFWTLSLMTFVLAGWPYSFHFWIPFLIAIPCLAGFITMSAVGHKALSIFLAVLFCAELITGIKLSDQPGEPGMIGILVLAVFLIGSIVPVIPVLRGRITV